MNIPILLYHSISSCSSNLYRPWILSPPLFEQHVIHLREQGYQPLTVKSIVDAIRFDGTELPECPVGITFDDGLADFYSGAMPILKKYNFPATLFVTTGYVGFTSRWLATQGEIDRPMLTWEEIESLEGVEIGAHGHSHLQLDLIPVSQAQKEIIYSKILLERHLSRSIDTFAFPHGYYTEELLGVVKEAGFSSSCIVEHTLADDSCNVFALPRINITADVTTEVLGQYLQGIGLRRRNIWRSFLRKAWRMVRWINQKQISHQDLALDFDVKSEELKL